MGKPRHNPTERSGLNLAQRIFEDELGWIFRRRPEADQGIDADVEVVVGGRPTGRMLGAQIRSGKSRFSRPTPRGYAHRLTAQHRDYWIAYSLPVLLILCDVEGQVGYWELVTEERIESTGKGWRLVVPTDHVLNFAAAPILRAVADLGRPTTRFAVPLSRNPGFIGRYRDLALVRQLLGDGGAPCTVGITGIGGIGKTQLAVEYVHAHRDDYPDGVYWANAAGGTAEGLAACAEAVGFSARRYDLSGPEATPALAEDLCRWLQANPHSLLVLDDLPEPAVLSDLLFGDLALSNLPCKKLFTSRDSGRQIPVSWHQMDVLPPDDSLALLLSHRPRADALTPDERAAAARICRMLGHLPLAVQQAGAYLAYWQTVSLRQYEDRLAREGRLRTADDAGLISHDLATRQRVGIALVLESSTRGLAGYPDALAALRTLALFREGEVVPQHRLAMAMGLAYEPTRGDEAPLSQALRRLTRASLVEVLSGDDLRLHPLVREFVLSGMSGEEQSTLRLTVTRNYAALLSDPRYLDSRVSAEGVEELLHDLSAFRQVCVAEPETARAIVSIDRMLGYETHNLWSIGRPFPRTYFLQQMMNRAARMDLPELADHVRLALEDHHGCYYLRESQWFGSGRHVLAPPYSAFPPRTTAAAFSGDGQLIAWGDEHGLIEVRHTDSYAKLAEVRGPDTGIRWLMISPDGGSLAARMDTGEVRVWDTRLGKVRPTWEDPQSLPLHLCWSADGRTLAAVALRFNGTLSVANSGGRGESVMLKGTPFAARAATLSADRSRVAAADGNGMVIVWDSETGEPVAALQGRPGADSITLSSDGMLLAVASRAGAVEVWSVPERRLVTRMATSVPSQEVVAFVRQGEWAVSLCALGALRIWELSSGQEVARYSGEQGSDTVWCSPSGTSLRIADLGGPTREPGICRLDITRIG